MFGLEFWKKVRDFADKKCRNSYLKKHSATQCPNCKLWPWQKENQDTAEYFHTKDVYKVQCGNCEHISFWNYGILPFGLSLQCDSNGIPLKSKEDAK